MIDFEKLKLNNKSVNNNFYGKTRSYTYINNKPENYYEGKGFGFNNIQNMQNIQYMQNMSSNQFNQFNQTMHNLTHNSQSCTYNSGIRVQRKNTSFMEPRKFYKFQC